MYIQIEGIDGAGKTTQVRRLKNTLNKMGYKTITVKEPDSTDFGLTMKKIIMSDIKRHRLADLFMFLAGKVQLYNELIIPNLARDVNVISDRGDASFLSYHHLATSMTFEELISLLKIATRDTRPNLTILLDVNYQTALERNKHKKEMSKFDRLGENFFNKQRELFTNFAKTMPNWHIIDGSATRKEVSRQIMREVSIFIK